MILRGYYDKQGNPCINIDVLNRDRKASKSQVKSIIDTGFTGFIQLPLHFAFDLSLPLLGRELYTKVPK